MSSDPIEKFLPEMSALLRRVWTAGGEAAIARLVAAARAGEPSVRPLPSHREAEQVAAPDTDAVPRRERKHPYGVVTRTITDLLTDNPNGLTRQQLRQFAQTRGVEIDDETAKNTLKVLTRREAAHSRDGFYFPGPARETGAFAPVSASTG